jgi:hypothetical protein
MMPTRIVVRAPIPANVWLLGEHQLRCGDAADPGAYTSVDITIRRWQSLTRKAAQLARTGKTFNEVAKERASIASPDAARRPAATAKREAA